MKNLMILGSTKQTQLCVNTLLNDFNHSFNLSSIVCDSSFQDYVLHYFESSNEISFISSDYRNESLIKKVILDRNIDYLISIQHPWILSKEIIDLVRGNAFNIHNGKIPLFSGFNSLSHYIIEGRSEMITTLHQIEEVVDTGLVACEKKTKIQVSDTAFSLYEKTLPVIQDLFIFLLNSIHADSIKLYKPFRSRRRYFPRNSLEKYKCLNNLNNLIFIKRIVRALYFPPHPPAYLKIGLQKYYLVEESHFNQINVNSSNITLPDPY